MSGFVTGLPDPGRMPRPRTDAPGVRHAAVVSEDGLRLGHASAEDLTGPVALLGAPEAESPGAACAAMTTTGRSTPELLFGGGAGVRRLMPEPEHGFVLSTQAGAGAGAHLAVATGTDADVGPVARQLRVLEARIGTRPSTGPRDPAGPSS